MNFLAPLGFALAALAIPILMLYMLRLRRREVPVSSTMLWQQILRDREANAPWQRLRRNLLLILQLLILAALVIALSRPYTEVPTITAGRVAVLIDASASMLATDVPPDRLEAARAEALALVDSIGASDTMAIIRVSGIPEVVAPYTNDRALLREAVNRIQADGLEGDWNAALTLAAAGFAGADKFGVVIIGDGGLPADLPPLPGQVRYVPIGKKAENVAIGALSVADDAQRGPQVYARLVNYGPDPVDVILSLKLDGALFNAQQHTIPANGAQDALFSGLPRSFRRTEASLTRPAASTIPDYLSLDDTAWAVYNPASAGRALVMTPRNRFIEQIFASLPGWQAFKGDVTKPLPTDKYDLYIFDNYLPPTLPAANLLIINPPAAPANALFTVSGATDKPSQGGAVLKDDPRTANLRFENVNIRTVKLLAPLPWATAIVSSAAAPGADPIPLVLAGEQAGRRVAILPFDLYDSDLPLQIAWPILVANLTAWYRTPRAVDLPNGAGSGATITIHPALTADSVRVTAPSGANTTLRPGSGPLIFAGTGQPGIYTVTVYQGSAVLQQEQFAVNFFDPLESRIAPASSIRIGSLTATAAETREIGQREYWPWVALMGLAVLAAEWYVYQNGARLPRLRRRPQFVRGKA